MECYSKGFSWTPAKWHLSGPQDTFPWSTAISHTVYPSLGYKFFAGRDQFCFIFFLRAPTQGFIPRIHSANRSLMNESNYMLFCSLHSVRKREETSIKVIWPLQIDSHLHIGKHRIHTVLLDECPQGNCTCVTTTQIKKPQWTSPPETPWALLVNVLPFSPVATTILTSKSL